MTYIKAQRTPHFIFFAVFGITSLFIVMYYLSTTIIQYTTTHQFPINSLTRYPLSIPIFLVELFSFGFAAYFLYNLFTDRYRPKTPKPLKNKPAVAFCIPVFNEPKDTVERTLKACTKVNWPDKKIYLLDDSNNDQHKKDMQDLSKKYGAILVRRPDNTGFKAGNINHAVAKAIQEEYFVILDSDQAPEKAFLQVTMDYFSDPDVFFVQTPQYYINDDTPLRRAAKIGTNIFYQTQCISKARDGALPFCGTNVIARTEMFRQIGGFSYYTSTEDIDLGLRANRRGWYGVFVPEVLVKGYAPPDWSAYVTQQYRWANGNLAILREGLGKLAWGPHSFLHQMHTFFTVGWWLIGVATLIYILVPLISVLTGMPTHHMWLTNFVLGLLYVNVMVGIMMIFVALNSRTEDDKVTLFDAFLQYSLITNSLFVYTRAAINALFRRYAGFVRTSKVEARSGLWDIKWNLLLALVCFLVSVFALYNVAIASDTQQVRTYLPISVWLLFYAVVLTSSILFVGKASQTGVRA